MVNKKNEQLQTWVLCCTVEHICFNSQDGEGIDQIPLEVWGFGFISLNKFQWGCERESMGKHKPNVHL